MTVYVDDMRARYGRMVMCHMLADTDEELHAMADTIGVARRWWQSPANTGGSHYDIALVKRAAAVRAGAVVITWRQAGAMNMLRRLGHPFGDPATAVARLAEIRAQLKSTGARVGVLGAWLVAALALVLHVSPALADQLPTTPAPQETRAPLTSQPLTLQSSGARIIGIASNCRPGWEPVLRASGRPGCAWVVEDMEP